MSPIGLWSKQEKLGGTREQRAPPLQIDPFVRVRRSIPLNAVGVKEVCQQFSAVDDPRPRGNMSSRQLRTPDTLERRQLREAGITRYCARVVGGG
jgi:hypothetical protein